jgi:dihydrofolate reductase
MRDRATGSATAGTACTSGEIHLVPVLLGQGRRLFDHLGPEHIELERTRILEGEAGVTHMRYRVQR